MRIGAGSIIRGDATFVWMTQTGGRMTQIMESDDASRICRAARIPQRVRGNDAMTQLTQNPGGLSAATFAHVAEEVPG
jgi:hypothetical protein